MNSSDDSNFIAEFGTANVASVRVAGTGHRPITHLYVYRVFQTERVRRYATLCNFKIFCGFRGCAEKRNNLVNARHH